jgi:hypothetical protein
MIGDGPRRPPVLIGNGQPTPRHLNSSSFALFSGLLQVILNRLVRSVLDSGERRHPTVSLPFSFPAGYATTFDRWREPL